MDSDQYARPMTLFVWVAVLCIVLTGFGIVGGAAESIPSEVDAEEGFAVNITSVNTSVTEGDSLIAEATISNRGSVADSQQIHLKNDDNEIVDSVAGPPVMLAPGESRNVTLAWETGPGDATNDEIRVVSNHGQDNRSVHVTDGSFLTIEKAESNSPVSPGNTLQTAVSVRNSDNHTATRDVWLAVNNDTVAETAVELAPGQNRTVTFAWTTPTEHAGNLPLTVGTMGDQQTIKVALVEPQPVMNHSERTPDWRLSTSVEDRDGGESAPSANGTTTADTSASETSNDESPGFGVITALLSLVMASGLVAHRRL